MNKWRILFIGLCAVACRAREPFKPRIGSVPYLVYFPSRYRGICVGSLVSRTVVLTAGVCVTHPTSVAHDTRPINVVTAASYRHPRRGIRVQVTRILLPKLSNDSATRGYLVQKSPALLLLYRRVPDVLAEVPLRAVAVDVRGEETLALHEECFMTGWHFFYKGDKIYPVHKFLLQRNVRVQFLNIAKKNLWCNTVLLKFQKALANIGYAGFYDKKANICIRDPERQAQPCHGMYGAPLICRGKVVGMLMAPDAQWTNCTGFTNLVHLISADHMQNFLTCTSSLFAPDLSTDWESMKKNLNSDYQDESFDYLPELYDRLLSGSSSSENEA